MLAMILIELDQNEYSIIDELRANIKVDCYGEEFGEYRNIPIMPLGRKAETYGLEIWDTKVGQFIEEKGTFNKIYGDDEE